jgi:Zn-dependent protease/CBS domain-containing protein
VTVSGRRTGPLRSIGAVTRPEDATGPGDPADSAATTPRGAVQIGRFLGVPLYLSSSWLIIGVAVTFGFADVFRTAVDGADGAVPYLLALAFAVLSVLSVLGHELGHVVAALALGLRVRRVFIFLLGGVSDIHPEPTRAGQELMVSAAGPLASGAIGAVAWLGTLGTAEHSALGVELRLLVWSNLIIAVFNALPGLPLDGGRVLRAAIWGLTHSRLTGTRVAAWGGRILAVLVAVGGVLFERGDLRLITVGLAVALGAFMWMGASQSLASAEMTARLPHLSSTTLLRRAIWVHADTPVDQAMRRLYETGARAIVVTDRADRPVAVVSEARITAVAESARAWTDVSEVADPVGAVHPLPLGLSGRDLLAACQVHPAGEYVVIDATGRGVGVLAMSDLRAALLSSKRAEGVLT